LATRTNADLWAYPGHLCPGLPSSVGCPTQENSRRRLNTQNFSPSCFAPLPGLPHVDLVRPPTPTYSTQAHSSAEKRPAVALPGPGVPKHLHFSVPFYTCLVGLWRKSFRVASRLRRTPLSPGHILSILHSGTARTTKDEGSFLLAYCTSAAGRLLPLALSAYPAFLNPPATGEGEQYLAEGVWVARVPLGSQSSALPWETRQANLVLRPSPPDQTLPR